MDRDHFEVMSLVPLDDLGKERTHCETSALSLGFDSTALPKGEPVVAAFLAFDPLSLTLFCDPDG